MHSGEAALSVRAYALRRTAGMGLVICHASLPSFLGIRSLALLSLTFPVPTSSNPARESDVPWGRRAAG